jgi:hypothetical protein
VALFIGLSKWSNSGRKSTILEVTVYIIRVVIREIDKCVGENRGYSALFIVRTQIS